MCEIVEIRIGERGICNPDNVLTSARPARTGGGNTFEFDLGLFFRDYPQLEGLILHVQTLDSRHRSEYNPRINIISRDERPKLLDATTSTTRGGLNERDN